MDKKDRTLAKQILLALGYTAQFEYPLTLSELRRRLPSIEQEWPRPTMDAIAQIVSLLEKKKLVVRYKKYVSLVSDDRSLQELISTRKQRRKSALQKKQEAEELFVFLQKIPFISGVLITGSVAMQNATKDDDVDFLIITKPGTMWVARPLVTVFAWLKKKRRSWKKEEKNSWCFNMWLDQRQLSLPPAQRSMYTAFELLQAEWVWADPVVHRQYYTTNIWTRALLPLLYAKSTKKEPLLLPSEEKISSNQDWYLFFLFPLLWLNAILYRAQLWYMRPHRTSEKVTKNAAFFHPRDTKLQLYSNWKKQLLTLVQ